VDGPEPRSEKRWPELAKESARQRIDQKDIAEVQKEAFVVENESGGERI
jgi:hypothetical protein